MDTNTHDALSTYGGVVNAIHNSSMAAIAPGGRVVIEFPHMKLEMSCDNETELTVVIDMLKKCLEVHETQVAKMALLRNIEKTEVEKASSNASLLAEERLEAFRNSVDDYTAKMRRHEATFAPK